MPTDSLHSRGVPAPINWRRVRLRLKAPTWISCRFRMFWSANVRLIPPVLVAMRKTAFHQFTAPPQ